MPGKGKEVAIDTQRFVQAMKQLAKAEQVSGTDVETMVFARLNNEKRLAADMAGNAPKFRMTKKQ